MSKFHIGKNGPAECKAHIKDCPIGGEHFSNIKEAETAYEEQMSMENKIGGHKKEKVIDLSKAKIKIINYEWDRLGNQVASGKTLKEYSQ